MWWWRRIVGMVVGRAEDDDHEHVGDVSVARGARHPDRLLLMVAHTSFPCVAGW
jgi:hypothetical protein